MNNLATKSAIRTSGVTALVAGLAALGAFWYSNRMKVNQAAGLSPISEVPRYLTILAVVLLAAAVVAAIMFAYGMWKRNRP